MCGIVGLIAKTSHGIKWSEYLSSATTSLSHRGPDSANDYQDDRVALGHCRLTIIDLSEEANQPMHQDDLVIIYNGEIFNFKELKKNLEQEEGVVFKTHSDTEVLLKLYRSHGVNMLGLLNGFFAFAIYDRKNKECFIARDRFGVKPLFYYQDEDRMVFASEIKALMKFPIEKKINQESLYEYLQLNYIPGPNTIFQNIKKLLPGHCIQCKGSEVHVSQWYDLEDEASHHFRINSYEEGKKKLFGLLNDAVRLRLISDVPLGAFLSGGIDSSIVCGLASRHTQRLTTFSIGYADDGFFDETSYAKAVAKHFNTDHTIFSLSREDLHQSLFDVLNFFDEPFGDSSALPVYILSKHTRQHVKVALSGDGADEIFGGYLKHIAEYRASHPRLTEWGVSLLSPVWKMNRKSRNTRFSNRMRQLQRFASGIRMNSSDRYWRWCSIADTEEADEVLLQEADHERFLVRKKALSRFAGSGNGLNQVLMNDVHLVLPDDMLMKTDSMSMANGLEVRTPFLDYRVVEFAFAVPASYKVDRRHRKKILHDAFRDFLPRELYHRPKRGFEIPLHSLLTHELKSLVEDYLSESFLSRQQIFNTRAVQQLRQKLFSTSPDESASRIWGLLVFQHWWKNRIE